MIDSWTTRKEMNNDCDKKFEFVFTFGCGQENAGFAQRVFANNFNEAKEKMNRKYGDKWAFQYTRKQWDIDCEKSEYPKERFLNDIIY